MDCKNPTLASSRDMKKQLLLLLIRMAWRPYTLSQGGYPLTALADLTPDLLLRRYKILPTYVQKITVLRFDEVMAVPGNSALWSKARKLTPRVQHTVYRAVRARVE